ncbi:MFS transporter [Schaalia vaccimaxillae]|uniref:MFS transporter n=1 Tax=Schaalia vaccimaxillae TaxID=183916 RepID=UPI0003B5EF92|nr:MFS transporter [Schaalia vaccimaxillae]
MSTFRTAKWVRLVVLALGVGVIFQLPYIRETFYVPLQNALQVNDAQMGALNAGFAMTATVSYFLGGFVADRFSSRKLIAFSLISTGLLGLWFASFPGYDISRLIYVLWGVTTIVTYFPALIKATRNLGGSDEQGRMFGFQEGLRGLANTLLVFGMLAVFNAFGGGVTGVSWAISVCAISNIVIGVLSYIFLADDLPAENRETVKELASGIVEVLKNPRIWLITAVVFTTYTAYGLIAYASPYIVRFAGASEELSVTIGGTRYIIQFFGGVLGGILADRIGSRLKVIIAGYVGIILTYGLYFVIPATQAAIPFLIANFMLGMFVIYVMRSLYFAIIDESRVPVRITGRASGVITALGYTPDLFTFIMVGSWMDSFGRMGFQMTFGYAMAMAAVGMVLAIILFRSIQRGAQGAPDPNETMEVVK